MKKYKLSPMMEHYMSLKKEYPDSILFYRLGDFYEMFFDDAIEASKILNLTLTGRECGLKERAPMCGIPHHAAQGYITKLVKHGKKVAICEQLSTPQDQKGMVKRDVVRVITPGTVTEEDMLEEGKNNYLLSLFVEGQDAGISWIDISTGELRVVEFHDTTPNAIEDFLMTILPSEIILNSQALTFSSGFESINQGRMVKPQPYYDYAFHNDNALKTILNFYSVNNVGAFGLEESFFAISSIGGLLEYIKSTQKKLLSHISPPKILRLSTRMLLDYNTKRNLELLETLSDRSKKGSLLDVVDKTKTSMGGRRIRRWIQEPLQQSNAINFRLDGVEEIYKSSYLQEQLGFLLNNIRDMERLCSKIAYGSINPRECLAISSSLHQISPIKKLLSKAKSSFLKDINTKLNPLPEIVTLFDKCFNENPPISVKDGGVIKKGYNGELDRYREAQTSGKKWLAEYEAAERNRTDIKTLKVGYNRVFGYYIEVSKSFAAKVPYEYERKQTLVGGERFTTPELKDMEQLILGAEEKAIILEEKLYAEIKELLLGIIKILQENSEAIACLDVIYSFAVVSAENNYCRPTIDNNIQHISIKEGRHPVVESLRGRGEFVANDAILDQSAQTLIITGPNMAGKSTYMRQVALIVLMAHIGCFVPAQKADICLVDRIFTRVGASDNLAFGQSTFMVEMTEMANILNNATPNSLLILDEIGRGTSTLDGLSIAWAIVEYVALKLKAKTLFATHYHELSELETIIPNLKNYHILIKEGKEGITFLYKIARGAASKSFGIEVASLAGVHPDVINRAKIIIDNLEETHSLNGQLNKSITARPSPNAVPTNQIGFFEEDSKMKSLIKVFEDIDLENCTPIQALTILADIKKNLGLNKGKRK